MKALFTWFLKHVPRPWLLRFSQWLRPFLDLWYRGQKHLDPINGKSYRSFLPYGYEKTRQNVLSPGTLSLERHRLFWLYLVKETDFFSQTAKVLHLAPEQAFLERFKKLKNLDYITADIESPLADVKADICNLPFENDSFDWVFCNHVLEHIEDDRKALSELFRVMKPNGKAILQVPLDTEREHTYEDFNIKEPSERARVFGQYDHVRIYGLDYLNRLKDAGFDASIISYAQQLTDEERHLYRIPVNEVIPMGVKPR
ncbi:MAG: methyltransferase domain-containing protein [Flavobacteriaceae bacterium]|nr:methyltransferase domain-containing protein [Flavobacteriaceae bacterium]